MAQFFLAFLFACLAASANAQYGPPNPTSPRDYEVLRDELPDALPTEELEIVLLGHKRFCIREIKRLWGFPISATNTDFDNTVCNKLVPLVLASASEPLLIRHELRSTMPSSVSQALAELEHRPTRRFVALVWWTMEATTPYNVIRFEEVVVDTSNGRWLWHAFRREQNWCKDSSACFAEAFKVWTNVLHHDLVENVSQRGRVRTTELLPGARWVAPSELATWQPGAAAGLILVNRDHKETSHQTGPFARLQIRRVDEPAAQIRVLPFGSWYHQFRPQHTPLMPHLTYVALELPPGDYAINLGSELRTTLKAGEKQVLSVEMRPLGMGDKLTSRDIDWFDRYRIDWPRHAFLADPSGVPGKQKFVFNEP